MKLRYIGIALIDNIKTYP